KSDDKVEYLDTKKIIPKNNDSIIVFKEELLKGGVGAPHRMFNVLVTFSEIVFSKDFSKSIIIGSRAWSGTDSHASIYFLEKQNGKWKIMFEKNL
ncbi:MAG: hypothetical protein ACWIPI_10570, partial [Polaribacter sp.]